MRWHVIDVQVFGEGSGFFDTLLGALRHGLPLLKADRAGLQALCGCYAAVLCIMQRIVK